MLEVSWIYLIIGDCTLAEVNNQDVKAAKFE